MADVRNYSTSPSGVVNNPGRPAWVPPQIHEVTGSYLGAAFVKRMGWLFLAAAPAALSGCTFLVARCPR